MSWQVSTPGSMNLPRVIPINCKSATFKLTWCTKPDQPPQGHNEDGRPLYDLDNAMKNLASVELLGRVEHFEQDVARFPSLLAARLAFRVEKRLLRMLARQTFH